MTELERKNSQDIGKSNPSAQAHAGQERAHHDQEKDCCCGHHHSDKPENSVDGQASSTTSAKQCCQDDHEHKEEETSCSCGHSHEHHHDHGHEAGECCCGHNHEHKHDAHCCGGHEHSHDHEHHHDEHCCCGHNHEHHHDHDHEAGECSCGHSHEHKEGEAQCSCGHSHEHDHDHHDHHHDGHCCCGHDHTHVENSMDTDWDVSEVHPSQYKLLFSTLGALAGIKDVGLNPDGLTIIHTPEALESIENAFRANGLKLKRVTVSNKLTSEIRIPQMDCPTEEGLIRKKLKAMKGVSGLQFNLMNRILTVSYQPGQLPEILAAIKSLDYEPQVIEGKEPTLAEFKPTQIPWWKYGLGFAFAAGSEICELAGINEYVSLALAICAILTVGLGTYKKGFIAVKNLNFNMNALMAVAVTGAVLIGCWPEAAMVMVLFEISEAIEQLALDKSRGAIRSLLALTPEIASVQKDGKWVKTNSADIKVGDIIRVEPGERLAVDGEVISGNSSINQSSITGESMPVDKQAGDAVFAGTLNENGEITYKATSTASNSMPARIISAIESAQSSRAPTQRFVDSFAKYYTPIVFIIAIATAILPPLFIDGQWFDWLYKGLTLLVIACPCALVISTPVTIVTALANAAKRGILIKGGVYLEKGRTLQTVAFDKTGTITEGKPKVQTWEVVTEENPKEILTIAASLAERNSHPVSKAVADKGSEEGIKDSDFYQVSGFYTVPGQGVIGSINNTEYYLGNLKGLDKYFLQNQAVRNRFSELAEKGFSPLVLASEKKVLAYFGVADPIKVHSKDAIETLNKNGITTVLLSGDNAKTAENIGKEVGVKIAKGNLLPEEKQSLINSYAKKRVTGMVGDGINDAPALARADIGFAMGAAGTDTAIETADVALMDDDLRKLPVFIELSKETFKILCQNIFFALAIKFIFFIMTYMGLATMWMAVFADTGTCLIVVANGLRLLRWKPSAER